MARYRFTARDLAPLRPWLDAPFAREVLEAAAPVKRFGRSASKTQELELAVDVQSRERPDGVPLPELLEVVRQEVPGVTGIVVRRGRAVLSHKAPLTEEQTRRIGTLLKDRRRLEPLRPPRRQPGAPESREALERILLDDATPDAEWLRAFRRHAVAELNRNRASRDDAVSRKRKEQ